MGGEKEALYLSVLESLGRSVICLDASEIRRLATMRGRSSTLMLFIDFAVGKLVLRSNGRKPISFSVIRDLVFSINSSGNEECASHCDVMP